jgi:hypothetical protein
MEEKNILKTINDQEDLTKNIPEPVINQANGITEISKALTKLANEITEYSTNYENAITELCRSISVRMKLDHDRIYHSKCCDIDADTTTKES